MANTKISALTAATTPVAGTEVLPIVQSSATKQVSIANLTVGRSVSAADYVMSTGNLVPSTAAKGVNFTANTAQAGMTSQLLNKYEEGTWTPTLGGMTVVGSPTVSGAYVIIGKVCFVTVTISGATVTNSAGSGYIVTPFTSTLYNSTVTAANNSTFTGYGNGFMYTSDTNLYPPSWAATSAVIVVNATILI